MSGGGGSPPVTPIRPRVAARFACAKTAGSPVVWGHGGGATTGVGNGPGSTTGVGQRGRVQPPSHHGAGSTTGDICLGMNCHWPAHGAGSLTVPGGGNPVPPVPPVPGPALVR